MILGLDVSTSITGATVIDDNGYLWIGTTGGLYAEKEIETIDCKITGTCPEELLIYPNPYFLSEGKFVSFILKSEFNGSLSIYDFSGNKVNDISCRYDSGYIDCDWDGKNQFNSRVSNGVYFCKILTSDGNEYWQKLGVVNLR